MQLNELTIAGFIGKDATEFTTPSGMRIVSFSICHSQKSKQGKETSTWVRVKVFGNWCESAIQIKKGDNVLAIGPLTITEFTKDGIKSTIVEMIANSFAILKKIDRLPVSEAEPSMWEDIPF